VQDVASFGSVSRPSSKNMSRVLEQLNRLSPELFSQLGFRIVDLDTEPEGRYSYVILELGDLRVRFQHDKYYREDTLAFAQTQIPNKWWGLALIVELTGGEGSARRMAETSQRLPFLIDFLKEHIKRIRDFFEAGKAEETERVLQAICDRRFRTQFVPHEVIETEIADLLSLVGDKMSSQQKQLLLRLVEAHRYISALQNFADVVIETKQSIPGSAVAKYAELARQVGLSNEESNRLAKHAQ
jgi:hypothetical protein